MTRKHIVAAHLDEATYRWVRKQAEEKVRSVSQWVLFALREMRAAAENPPAPAYRPPDISGLSGRPVFPPITPRPPIDVGRQASPPAAPASMAQSAGHQEGAAAYQAEEEFEVNSMNPKDPVDGYAMCMEAGWSHEQAMDWMHQEYLLPADWQPPSAYARLPTLQFDANAKYAQLLERGFTAEQAARDVAIMAADAGVEWKAPSR